jgi:predicted ATPase
MGYPRGVTLTLSTGTVDLDAGVLCRLDGTVEHFTPVERKLLGYLAANPGRAVSREELQREVWGYREGILSRTVFTTVGRVRSRIEADPARPTHLVTLGRDGYTLQVGGGGPRQAWAPRPAVAGPLVGRDVELSDLSARLDEGARLVTLQGPGGIGKTRLAVELLARRSGVFVSLEAVVDVAAVPTAIATALGDALSGSQDPWGELATIVGSEPLLVILDNVEQILGLGAAAMALLAACPELTIVTTSRVRLGLRVEHVIVVPPLAVPGAGPTLREHGAGRLLLSHAARARPGWSPLPHEADTLATICARVGGSPLGLELAAAWLRLLEPSELLDELDRPGQVLRALDRDVPERHRSLSAALSASWRLLSPAATRALEAIGAFREPFDRADALAVAEADLTILGELVDASVLHRAASPPLKTGRRFDLHPLLRAEARARLEADDARRAEVAARHARHFLRRLVGGVAALESTGDRGACAALLQPAHADILAAWADRAAVADLAALSEAGPALYRYLDLANRIPEILAAFTLAGECLASSPEGSEGEAVAAGLGVLAAGAGGLPDRPVAELLHAVRRSSGPLRAAALIHAAIAALNTGGPSVALAIAEEAVREPATGGFLPGFALAVRGSIRMRLGHFEDARVDLSAAMEGAREGRASARPYVHLGEVELFSGAPARARTHLQEALAACRATDDRSFATLALCRLGQAMEALGEDPDAVYGEAVEEGVCSRLPRVWWAAALAGLGVRWAQVGRVEEGVVLLAAAAAGPHMEAPGRIEAALEVAAARLTPAVRPTVVRAGRAATDVELLARVRAG